VRQGGGAVPASGGAKATRRWGPPFAVGPSSKRRARACELNRDTPWWRRRRATAHGGQEKVFKFHIPLKQMNSNQDLNPNTQKQCTSMNATVNSYISLINQEK
jgi:hypothetical protein